MSYRNRKRPERKRYWPWFASMLSSFLMGVQPAHIEGIGCENLQNFRVMAHQIGVTLGKLAKLPVKMAVVLTEKDGVTFGGAFAQYSWRAPFGIRPTTPLLAGFC